MLLKIVKTQSPEETEDAAYQFAVCLRSRDFVALSGDLGAGKTAFVRGIARRIAPTASVKSPTYSIVREYSGATEDCTDVRLCHFDLYRIHDEDDLASCGWDDYTDALICAEWCENIPCCLPKAYYQVIIEKTENENERIITISKTEERK